MVIILFLICIVIGISIWSNHKRIQLIKTVTSPDRGESSERDTIIKLIACGINPKAIFHDCYIRTSSGTYTQVDLVVATSQGLLVFEIKDYSGWVFGHYRQKYWTQVLAFGHEKHRFYNPIIQNQSHINAIRQNLPHNPDIPIYNIIVFYGDCTLKDITFESDKSFILYPSEIKDTVNNILCRPAATFGDKYEIMNVLTQSVDNGSIPDIVYSQRMTAAKAAQNRPPSSYTYYRYPFGRFKRWD